jgi:ABC-2 type transport system permease protein
MNVAAAFIRRDLSLNLSYRLSFFLQFVSIFFAVASAYFVSRLFGNSIAPQLAEYGGDYFSFALIGIAFNSYLGISLTSFAQSIREGQQMGTLEIMLLSPTRLSSILVSSSLWPYVFTTIHVIIYMVFGIAVFGFDVSQANFVTALVVLIVSVASFSGIGILSAAMVLLFKKGDPIAWLYGGVSTVLSGVYYPISVLPAALGMLSRFLPLTYALDAMRLAILKGASLYDIRVDLLALLGFTVVLTPLSFFVFQKALKRAKMEGSLIQY